MFSSFSFGEYADVTETWGDDDYDRTGAKPWMHLSNAEKVRKFGNSLLFRSARFCSTDVLLHDTIPCLLARPHYSSPSKTSSTSLREQKWKFTRSQRT